MPVCYNHFFFPSAAAQFFMRWTELESLRLYAIANKKYALSLTVVLKLTANERVKCQDPQSKFH